MSEFDLEDHVYPDMPVQDYSELGLDTDVVRLLVGDLHPENPDRYQNAGIWAGLITEKAFSIAGSSALDTPDINQAQSYVHGKLVEPVEGDELVVAQSFADTLFSNAILDHRSHNFGDGLVTTFRTWQFTPSTIGHFVEKRLEFKDLGLQAAEAICMIKDGSSSLSPNQLQSIGNDLDAIRLKLAGLTSQRSSSRILRYSRRNSSRTGEPQIDYGFSEIRDDDIRLHIEIARDKSRIEAAIKTATQNAEYDQKIILGVGVKGANLLKLSAALAHLKAYGGIQLAEIIDIPRFNILRTEVYNKWQKKEPISKEIRNIAKWMAKNPETRFIARSSAVYSEDSDNMGAGIYESVLLPPNASSIDLYKAVREVYMSVDTDEAKSYRKSIGVEEEHMAVVIQEVATSVLDETCLVTVNTVMSQVPQLSDFTLERGPHPLHDGEVPVDIPHAFGRHYLPLDRQGMLFEFGTSVFDNRLESPRFHVFPDTDIHNAYDIWLSSQAAIFAERIIGRPVQVELVIPVENHGISIVKARPLPDNWVRPVEFVGFPEDHDPDYEGRGVGVYNGVEATKLESIYYLDEIDRKEYVLIVWDSSFAKGKSVRENISGYLDELTEAQRSKIICLVRQEPESGMSGYGHLETLFTEKGIGLIFYDLSDNGFMGARYADGEKVTIYSNGYKAKIYTNPNDPVVLEAAKKREEEFGF